MRDEDSQAETYDGCGRQAGQARGRVTGSSTSRSHRLCRNPEPGNWPSDRRSNEARCADAHQIHGDGSGVCENPSDAANLARWKWIALVHRLPADLQCCTESRIGRDRLLSNCRYLRSVYSSPPAVRHAASTMGVLASSSPRPVSASRYRSRCVRLSSDRDRDWIGEVRISAPVKRRQKIGPIPNACSSVCSTTSMTSHRGAASRCLQNPVKS